MIIDDDDVTWMDGNWILANVVAKWKQSRDSDGGKGHVTTPIKDDSEGHLIYKAGDVINGRCT